MSVTNTPETIFEGKRAVPRIITRSHGIVRPNLMETFNFTPKLELKSIDEFDNPVAGLLYQTFAGGTGKIGYVESNQNALAAAMFDVDPTVTNIVANPTSYVPFDFFANLKGLDGKIKASMLCYGCQLSGNPFDMTAKEASKRTLDFMCLNGIILFGTALAYTRMRGATGITMDTPPAVPALSTATTGGFLPAGTYYVMITGVTAGGETLPSGEAYITVPSGTSTNTVVVDCPNATTPYTGFNVYISNVSNGETFIGEAIASSTNNLTVTTLPTFGSPAPPQQNTSGPWIGSKDVLASGSGPWTWLLNQPAIVAQPSGLPYGLVKLDGNTIATVDNPATQDTWSLVDTTVANDTFQVNATPIGHVWEAVTLYQP